MPFDQIVDIHQTTLPERLHLKQKVAHQGLLTLREMRTRLAERYAWCKGHSSRHNLLAPGGRSRCVGGMMDEVSRAHGWNVSAACLALVAEIPSPNIISIPAYNDHVSTSLPAILNWIDRAIVRLQGDVDAAELNVDVALEVAD